MRANVNQMTPKRPNWGVIAFAIGLALAILAWLRHDPEYVQSPVPTSAGEPRPADD